MFSLRLCCWNSAVLWYLGYLLYFFHGSSSIDSFFMLFRYAIKAKVNDQTALFYAALEVTPEAPHRTVRQVRVKQMRCSQWAVLVRRDAVEGFAVPCCVSGP